ncbi:phosphatidylinositol-specific phospholipase C [Bacillus cereus]|uniref:phosphatidylinositol-specific phospholipase C n=1 Tax=Bacillus cereus TaxID=1396 RepID=UPI003D65585B
MKYKYLMMCTIVMNLLSTPNVYADKGYSFEKSMDAGNISMNLKTWMSVIPNEAPLSTLSIPGTHDSMALHDGAAFGYAKDQAASLSTQLEKGIRYLDIRIRDTGDSFAIHHGPVYQEAMFGDVLNMVVDFLKNNPSETIVMRVKNEHEQDLDRYDDIFQNYLKKYGSYFWTPTSYNPKLGEVRGKIVILQDSPAKFGIPYSTLNIEDSFENVTYGSKWDIIWRRLDDIALTHNPNQIYLSYFSANTPDAALGGSPKSYAEFINPRGISYLKAQYKTFTGIIAADFPDTSYTQSIIYKNYLYYSLPTDSVYTTSVNMNICTQKDYSQDCVEDMDPSYRTHEMYERINQLVEDDDLNEQTNWTGKSWYNFIRFNYLILPTHEKTVLNKLREVSRTNLSISTVLEILNGYHNNTNQVNIGTLFPLKQTHDPTLVRFQREGVTDTPPAKLQGFYTDTVNSYPTWVQLGIYNKMKLISQCNPEIWNELTKLGFSLNDQTKEVLVE